MTFGMMFIGFAKIIIAMLMAYIIAIVLKSMIINIKKVGEDKDDNELK